MCKPLEEMATAVFEILSLSRGLETLIRAKLVIHG